jgi:hypothetical protein
VSYVVNSNQLSGEIFIAIIEVIGKPFDADRFDLICVGTCGFEERDVVVYPDAAGDTD